MKICFFTQSYFEPPSKKRKETVKITSAEIVHIYELTKNLSELGNKITLIAPNSENNEIKEEFNGVKLIKSKPGRFNLLRKLISSIKKERLDIIYQRLSFEAVISIITSFITGRKLIFEINGLPIIEDIFVKKKKYSLKNMILNSIYRICLNYSGAIITVSEGLKNILIKWGIKERKIFHVSNGVNINFINPELNSSKIKKRYDLQGKKILLMISTLNPWHGALDLIEAINLIKEKIGNLKLLLVGDGPLYNKIKNMIEKFGLEKNVILVGRVSYLDIPEFIKACDIAIAVFVRNRFLDIEGITPLKIFEYMAAGKPVIASNIGEINRYIRNNIEGYLVKPGDVKELSNKIIELIEDDEKIREFGLNARQRVIKDLSWKSIAETIEGILKRTYKNKL